MNVVSTSNFGSEIIDTVPSEYIDAFKGRHSEWNEAKMVVSKYFTLCPIDSPGVTRLTFSYLEHAVDAAAQAAQAAHTEIFSKGCRGSAGVAAARLSAVLDFPGESPKYIDVPVLDACPLPYFLRQQAKQIGTVVSEYVLERINDEHDRLGLIHIPRLTAAGMGSKRFSPSPIRSAAFPGIDGIVPPPLPCKPFPMEKRSILARVRARAAKYPTEARPGRRKQISCIGRDRWPSFGQLIGGSMAKVTGIGGVFFKSTGDSKALAAWYQKNLGLALEDWGGALLKWPEDRAEDKGMTVWHVAEAQSEWFAPSQSSFMINYRVDDLTELLARLRENGVIIHKGPESHENGKFAWILDLDGNKVELWEPKNWDEKNKNL
jgi:predicted enzyme related to lactoylglutathione lyase